MPVITTEAGLLHSGISSFLKGHTYGSESHNLQGKQMSASLTLKQPGRVLRVGVLICNFFNVVRTTLGTDSCTLFRLDSGLARERTSTDPCRTAGKEAVWALTWQRQEAGPVGRITFASRFPVCNSSHQYRDKK